MKKTLAVITIAILCLSTFSMLFPIGKATGGVQLTDNLYGGAYDPQWSPDGSKVVFYQFDSTQWYRHIWTIDFKTQVATQLTFGSVVQGMPEYSPDGSRIIFNWWGFRGDYNDFAIMNPDGSGLQSIPYNPPDYPVSGIDYIHPEFSPDGRMIAFHYGVGTTWGHSTAYVATMAFDATTLRLSQLKLLATGGQPRWSPDGTQLIYHTGYISPSPDPSQIMIMDASGSNVRAVTGGPYDYTPDMAVDGKIVFVRCNSAMAERGGRVESNLYLIPRIGEAPVQLTFDSGVWNWLPAFSPDGTKIAYMSDRSGSPQIWVMELGHSLTIDTVPSGVTFTVDGSSHTTPWSGTYTEGVSVELVMPENHFVGSAKYQWDKWSDGVTSRTRTVTMNTDVSLIAEFIGPYYQLTVTSSPITGIPFTINTTSKITPYTEWLPEGHYTLEMPQTYNGYKWSKWLEDGDTSRVKTIYLHGTTWTGVYVSAGPPTPPVGGEWIPINKLQPLAPLISLISLMAILTTSFVYVKRKRRSF